MDIVISSGHGKYVRGASGYIDEVDQARRVVDTVAAIINAGNSHTAKVFHDNTSTSQDQNLKTIVNFHNAQTRDLDVSVHFNAYETTSKPMGAEVWHYSQAHFAGEVSRAISVAGGFIDRGAKKSTSLYFLVHTEEPAILIEVCFVDSKADTELYHDNFEDICQAIASTLVGEENIPSNPPPEGPDTEARPMLRKGDEGPWVTYLQEQLNADNRAGLVVDGDFGSATDNAVRNYQGSRRLDVDGIVGDQTWTALETDQPAYVPPGLPPPMSDSLINGVVDIAENSDVAQHNWSDRGVAPIGYTNGVALAFANTYRQMKFGYEPAIDMAKADTGNADKDALTWYADIFRANGMSNDASGGNTLRHLFTLLMGLGMRESSGKHCEGRDQSADNTTSDTAEAGAWQTSYNAKGGSPWFQKLFDAYNSGGGQNPQSFLEQFSEGVSCSNSSWTCYGTGNGYRHQQMSKEQPAYAAEVCAITLRNLRQHYGPINRKEAEVLRIADGMLRAVQYYVENEDVSV